MRYSSDEADPGYDNWAAAMLRNEVPRVFLDGWEIKDAELADEDEGIVRRAKKDIGGNLIVKDDELVTEILRGKVEVRCEATA